ncbi:hypothetical protein POM88_029369 [Heracleum sosnowskyi]|uniref:Uncharacterized protein n=1 Tax=Heracleum sosnowskyi TaxID=360622 RepID=A0AAD8HTX0_9APIA|nr:hypothetical protein POM88_029369 [Heracleum sosnowskyi]
MLLSALNARGRIYVELCEKEKVDPNNAAISMWVKVVRVRKNNIIGVPRMKDFDIIIIPIERSRKRRRRHDDDESSASTNGRPYHMSDDCVIQVMDQTVAYARRHPEEFGLAPEQVLTLEKSVSATDGDDELSVNYPLGMGTMTELVRVMVMVLTNIQARQEPNNNNGKSKYVMREDDCSSSDGDDVRHSSHSPPPE